MQNSDGNIANNLNAMRAKIAVLATANQRTADSIQLMAVCKTRTIAEIEQAIAAGQTIFGENYLQEALPKIQALKDSHEHLQWHFIGPIQSNKTKAIAENFDWVDSVDRTKIAERLSAQRPADLAPLNVCIQVNISNEAQKSGLRIEQIPALAETISALPRLCLRGLMAIGAAGDDATQQRPKFARLKTAFDQLQAQHPQLDTLSMGMSGDYPAAIAAGATLIRIGTAIFGQRSY